MYIWINIYNFLVWGDIVQMGRDMAMIALGALGVLAYQKYKQPIKEKMDCLMDTAIDTATEKLEKMK